MRAQRALLQIYLRHFKHAHHMLDRNFEGFLEARRTQRKIFEAGCVIEMNKYYDRTQHAIQRILLKEFL